jgi:hypothetical protein
MDLSGAATSEDQQQQRKKKEKEKKKRKRDAMMGRITPNTFFHVMSKTN